MNKQTKYTLLPKLSLESVYTDPINWIVVRDKDQDHSCLDEGGSIWGAQAHPGGSSCWLRPSGGPSLESLLGRWAQTGAPGTGNLTPWPGYKLYLV